MGTSSRIFRGSPAVFVLSRNFAVTYALFGYFWVNLPDFPHFLANFDHFLTAFISRFLRTSPALFLVSRIFTVTYALFGYFWVNFA